MYSLNKATLVHPQYTESIQCIKRTCSPSIFTITKRFVLVSLVFYFFIFVLVSLVFSLFQRELQVRVHTGVEHLEFPKSKSTSMLYIYASSY